MQSNNFVSVDANVVYFKTQTLEERTNEICVVRSLSLLRNLLNVYPFNETARRRMIRIWSCAQRLSYKPWMGIYTSVCRLTRSQSASLHLHRPSAEQQIRTVGNPQSMRNAYQTFNIYSEYVRLYTPCDISLLLRCSICLTRKFLHTIGGCMCVCCGWYLSIHCHCCSLIRRVRWTCTAVYGVKRWNRTAAKKKIPIRMLQYLHFACESISIVLYRLEIEKWTFSVLFSLLLLGCSVQINTIERAEKVRRYRLRRVGGNTVCIYFLSVIHSPWSLIIYYYD